MPTLAQNPRAKFDYEILKTFEAGIVMTGQEVKSVREEGEVKYGRLTKGVECAILEIS